MTSETKPWDIEWFICKADVSDVKYARSIKNKQLQVGDELWRVPMVIGPISVTHDHWAGHHLECDPEVAYQVSAIPLMLEALERAETKLKAYVDVCKGDTELTKTVVPMVERALSVAKGTENP